MKKLYQTVLFLILPAMAWASEAIKPTITPALFQPDTEITITYDVTGTTLANLTDAYAWFWIPGKNINAKYNVSPASTNTASTNHVKFTKSVAGGKTLFTLVVIPSELFDGDISSETQLGILLKGNDWSNGQTADYVASFWNGDFIIQLLSPVQQPLFVDNDENILVQAVTPVASVYKLYVNDILVDTQSGITSYSYNHTVTETSGYGTIKLVASAGSAEDDVSFLYIISSPAPVAQRPAGVIPGINYQDDDTKVILCLLAPNKSSVYAFGDFSGWKVLPENQMNKDGEFFWIELTDLVAGQEYGYQYLVGESIRLADPYADKILDPDDKYIPASTYPALKSFPAGALTDQWYFNRVAVFQTNQAAYEWKTTGYVKPDKKDMVIYELHIRDFFAEDQRNYQNLIDTINYFKRLGINAIELMPIMEFAGNDSWGYNPTFMFAPDKYYGTKNKLKEFIDVCHREGIAVILDIAMNHQDAPSPYLMMDFNYETFKPNPTNPWFNVEAPHPFSVFFDLNHESSYTKQYLDTVNYYWLNEFKVDGFRFDLSKGFTQKDAGGDVASWSDQDDSRIALLERMSDKIRTKFPEAILILEHLAANTEEKILAHYGFMLWGNMSQAFAQNTMGYSEGSDIEWASYKTRNWNEPNLVAYMESHDEERMMFKNITYGNGAGDYSIKNIGTALDRVKAAAAFYFTIPGPKMIWQFGEWGYDVSIDYGGRAGDKPVKWEYYDVPSRKKLFNTFTALIELKKNYSIFETSDIDIQGGTSLLKQITLRNSPYTDTPATTGEMNVYLIGNFDVTPQSFSTTFPHTGNWFHYFADGEVLNITNPSNTILLQPGEFRLYTDVKLPSPLPGLVPYTNTVTSVEGNQANAINAFPNPVQEQLMIRYEQGDIESVSLISMHGIKFNIVRLAKNVWDVSSISSGVYIAQIRTKHGFKNVKIIKH